MRRLVYEINRATPMITAHDIQEDKFLVRTHFKYWQDIMRGMRDSKRQIKMKLQDEALEKNKLGQ